MILTRPPNIRQNNAFNNSNITFWRQSFILSATCTAENIRSSMFDMIDFFLSSLFDFTCTASNRLLTTRELQTLYKGLNTMGVG